MTDNIKSLWRLEQWLDYLENRHVQEVQLRLVNPQRVARIMDVATWSIPVITVGGTNGKGSTVAALSAIYRAAGYRVGQFTSPHLLTFNERICINDIPISDKDLCEAFLIVEHQRQHIPLTYFEVSFLAALWYFKQTGLDVLILEVGIGGRLDATNSIDADLAIITTVDLDHQDYLGPDTETIGLEKAGILRAHQPFVYADFDPPRTVIEHARALETQMDCLGETYHYHSCDKQLYITILSKATPIILPEPNIHLNAAAAAVVATERLQSRLPVKPESWTKAMQSVWIRGRRQWITSEPVTLLFDVAHNPQATRLLAQTLLQYQPQGKVHAVFSALQNKDICGLIRPLSKIINQWYLTSLTGKRATSLADLQELFANVFAYRPLCYAEPKQAYAAAVAKALPGDIIVVFGSFLLVEAVMKARGVYE